MRVAPVVAAGFIGSCMPADPGTKASGQSAISTTTVASQPDPATADDWVIVDWPDSVALPERQAIRAALKAVHTSAYRGSGPIVGAIHRLGASSAQRYMLLAMVPGEGHSVVRLFLLRPGSDSITPTPVFDTDVLWDGQNFVNKSFVDLDGDGLVDYGYCSYKGDSETGVGSAVGFRDGKSYRIHRPDPAPSCTP